MALSPLSLLLLLIAARCLEPAPPPNPGKLCTVESPLRSSCRDEQGKDDFRHCGRVSFNDSGIVKCPPDGKLYFPRTSTNSKKPYLQSLTCNRKTGIWEGKSINIDMKENDEKLSRGTKVYCHYDDCNMNDFVIECGRLDEGCVKYRYADYTFTCPNKGPIWTLKYDDPSGKYKKYPKFRKFKCKRGNLHANGTALEAGIKLRCMKEAPKPPASTHIGWYIFGVVVTLVLIIALLFYCAMRNSNFSWTKVAFGGKSSRHEKKYDFDAPAHTPDPRSPSNKGNRTPVSPGFVSPRKHSAEAEPDQLNANSPSAQAMPSRDRTTAEDLPSKDKLSKEPSTQALPSRDRVTSEDINSKERMSKEPVVIVRV